MFDGVSGLVVIGSEEVVAVEDAIDNRLDGLDEEAEVPVAAAEVEVEDSRSLAAIELAIEARKTADLDGGRVESRSPSRLGGRTGGRDEPRARGGPIVPFPFNPEVRSVELLDIVRGGGGG
jgi:hypothetical protein